MNFEENELEDFPLTYSIDNAILMHRDVHFGGNFQTMLNYYQNEGKGISKDFEIKRIQELAEMEQRTKKNLAVVMLSGPEAEKVAHAKQAYIALKELYEIKKPKSPLPILLADLILSEEKEEAKAVEAVVAQKSAIVPLLVDLLRNEEFYDPLFPGYGMAPALAAQCLGKIGDKRAIISLFESIGEEDFFNEDVILNALKEIGKPAKDFLLKVVHGRPLNHDNERAAIALVFFKDEPDVSEACLKMLQEIDLNTHLPLATYLVLSCEGLKKEEDRKALIELGNRQGLPKTLNQDIKAVAANWSAN